MQEVDHGLFRIEQPFVHIDVDDLGAAFYLMLGHREGLREIPRFDEAGKFAGAGHVGPLAYVDEVGVGADDQGLQAAEFGILRHLRYLAGRQPFHCFRHQADVVRGGAAAAADDVDEAAGGELADVVAHLLGGLVVLAELVGQPGIGVGADEAVGDGG